jgi:hypothetical protein
MSPETVRLLTSHNAAVGYLLGVVALLIVGIVAMVRPRPVPVAGVMIAAAGVVAVHLSYVVPPELVAGVGLLALTGLVPVRSDLAAMALALPGAAVLGYTFAAEGGLGLIILVVVGSTVLGPLVARFDSTHPDTSGTSLMVVAYGAALILVPDTDLIIVVAAAALPLIVAGHPLRLARLGRGGAVAATGLLLWTAAGGAEARSAAVVAASGVLGLLVADPVMRRLRGSRGGLTRIGEAPLLGVAVQIALALSLSFVAGSVDHAALLAIITLALLSAAGFWSSSPV